MKYAGAIRFLLAAAAICLGGGADAETRASVEGKTIKIVVPLLILLPAYFDERSGKYVGGPGRELTFTDPISGEEVFFDQMKSSWETLSKDAADMWIDAFRRFPYRGCYEADVEIALAFAPEFWTDEYSSLNTFKSQYKPGHHRVHYRGEEEWTPRHYGKFGGRRPFGFLDPTGIPTEDTLYPYKNTHILDIRKMLASEDYLSGEGYMSGPFEHHHLAHEIGHLMGLADDFVRITENGETVMKVKPGREGTFMAEHESKNIDGVLTKRIGDLVVELDGIEMVETCRCWIGRISEWRHKWQDPDPEPDPQRRTCDVSEEWTATADVVLREDQPMFIGVGKSLGQLEFRRVKAEVTDTLRAGRDCRTTTVHRKGVISAPTLDGPDPSPSRDVGNIIYASKETDFLYNLSNLPGVQVLLIDPLPDRVPGQYFLPFPSLCEISDEPWQHPRANSNNVPCRFEFDAGSPGFCEGPRFLDNDMARMSGARECSKDWQFTSEIRGHWRFKVEWDLERVPCAAVPWD